MPSTTREAMSISDNRLDAATTTFEPPTTSTGSKRKRDLTDTNPVGVGIDHSQGRTYKEQLHQLFKDTVEILRR